MGYHIFARKGDDNYSCVLVLSDKEKDIAFGASFKVISANRYELKPINIFTYQIEETNSEKADIILNMPVLDSIEDKGINFLDNNILIHLTPKNKLFKKLINSEKILGTLLNISKLEGNLDIINKKELASYLNHNRIISLK